MNVVLVLIDSLNRGHLSSYGDTSVATPNLDRLARRCWRFDSHYVGSLPCMPARRELLAGRRELMWRAWGPLEPYDLRLPDLLRDAGVASGIVTDHYHYWEEPGNGYLQGFDSSTLIRGHEVDRWRAPLPPDEPLPRWVRNMVRWRPEGARRYYANVRDFQDEEDFFPARVFQAAARWLGEHPRGQPFYLQVESFDVHEPFHVPEPYASMYGPAPDEVDFTIWPPYQRTEEQRAFMASAGDAELEFIRAQYAGKLTMTDRWLGELLDVFDQHTLWDDTALLLSTDHGHDLGEHGGFGKQFPHRDSHANIPLFAWHPASPGHGRSIDALTTTVDLFPTVLELAAAEPVPCQGESLMPLLTSASATDARDALLYGSFGTGACATDGEWSIMKAPVAPGPLFSYSTQLFESLLTSGVPQPVAQGHFIPGVPYPQWRYPVRLTKSQPTALEDVLTHRTDGDINRWDDEPAARRRMLDLLRELVDAEGAPPEQYERLGLRR